MAHNHREEAERILDKEYRVLDKGFVRLVDYMGSDERIVQSARVSYGRGTKTVRQDRALIDYLLRNEHTSPFEQIVMTFHVKLPIFVARQWIRHRTARVNEISGRYSVMDDAFYVPQKEDVALQSTDNKQGRDTSAQLSNGMREEIRSTLENEQTHSYEQYRARIEKGIARELARVNLPLSIYTEWYWQIDLHNLMHFLKLRLDPHAQKEIREYAIVIHEIASAIVPMAMESFDIHIRKGCSLSAKEIGALKDIITGSPVSLSEKEYTRFAQKLGLTQQQLSPDIVSDK